MFDEVVPQLTGVTVLLTTLPARQVAWVLVAGAHVKLQLTGLVKCGFTLRAFVVLGSFMLLTVSLEFTGVGKPPLTDVTTVGPRVHVGRHVAFDMAELKKKIIIQKTCDEKLCK